MSCPLQPASCESLCGLQLLPCISVCCSFLCRITARSPVHAHCAHPSQPLPSRAHSSPKPCPQVKCYLRQLFSGLALLEINEVLHRDLKNANLVSIAPSPTCHGATLL